MKHFIRFIVRKIPRIWLIRFSYLFGAIVRLFYIGNKVECPICLGHFRKFLPYGNRGIDNRLCPKCLSLERHRQLWLYLKNETDFFGTPKRLLHIAPEQPFLKRFKQLNHFDYVTADLESPIADVKMDIQNIPFEDNSFDMILCNHVLEHIKDDLKALRELHRVLRKGGKAIIQIPIDLSRSITFEDSTITDPHKREQIFGQYDHLRVYGTDFPQRFELAGFEVVTVNYTDKFNETDIERYRLIHEPFFIGTK